MLKPNLMKIKICKLNVWKSLSNPFTITPYDLTYNKKNTIILWIRVFILVETVTTY